MKKKLNLCILSSAILVALAQKAIAVEVKETDENTIERITVSGENQQLKKNEVITATRTATPLERVPQSVQILFRDMLEQQDLQTLSDAMNNVSGVTPSSTMQSVLFGPSLRGFGTSYFFDGMPAYQLPAGAADPATLLNVDRIEVVKGPSNSLYGGGTGAPLSGLINVVSRDPGTETAAEIELRTGSYNTLGTQGRIDLPIMENLQVSLAAMTEHADSFLDVVDSERKAWFPTIAWQPSGQTKITLRGQFNQLKQQEYSGLPKAIVGLVDDKTFAGATDAPKTEVNNSMLTLTLDHTFDDGSNTQASVRRYNGDFMEYASFPLMQLDNTVYAFGTGVVPADIKQTFVTATYNKATDFLGVKHNFLVGTDFDDTYYYGAMGLDFAWGILDYASSENLLAFGAVPAITDEQDDSMKTFAVFLQDQIALTNKWDLTISLRWSHLNVKSSYVSGGVPFVSTDESYKEFSPRVGMTYQLTASLAAFAGYASGFRGLVAAFGVPNPDPEKSDAYEVGLKLLEPVDGLTGTISMFDITRTNVITADPNNPFQSIQTGEQQSRGFETDLFYQPTNSALSVLVNYAYTKAEITEDNAIPVGDQLRAIPKHKGRLALSYELGQLYSGAVNMGLGVTLTSSRELTLPNTTTAAGSAIWDLQSSWRSNDWTLGLSVVNLTGHKGYEPYQYFGGQYVIPVQPRSIYFRLRRSF